jgi:hypothetical protein
MNVEPQRRQEREEILLKSERKIRVVGSPWRPSRLGGFLFGNINLLAQRASFTALAVWQ